MVPVAVAAAPSARRPEAACDCRRRAPCSRRRSGSRASRLVALRKDTLGSLAPDRGAPDDLGRGAHQLRQSSPTTREGGARLGVRESRGHLPGTKMGERANDRASKSHAWKPGLRPIGFPAGPGCFPAPTSTSSTGRGAQLAGAPRVSWGAGLRAALRRTGSRWSLAQIHAGGPIAVRAQEEIRGVDGGDVHEGSSESGMMWLERSATRFRAL